MKKGFIFLIILFSLLVSITFISAFSFSDFYSKITGKVTDTQTCMDSDGEDYSIKGIVTVINHPKFGNKTFLDTCANKFDTDYGTQYDLSSSGDTLVEITCLSDGKTPDTIYYEECPNGCQEGVCVGEVTEECIPDCVDKTCGDDSCGGNCGTCDVGQTCTADICGDVTETVQPPIIPEPEDEIIVDDEELEEDLEIGVEDEMPEQDIEESLSVFQGIINWFTNLFSFGINDDEIILEAPIPDDLYCLSLSNVNNPDCGQYYLKTYNISVGKSVFCKQYFNPVYDSNEIFYPSACWAEAFGVEEYTYGYSPKLIQFFSQQWEKEGYNIPHPNIEFTYGGDTGGWIEDMRFRSTIWYNDAQHFSVLDYLINSSGEVNKNKFLPVNTLPSIVRTTASRPNALMVYIPFDNLYPEDVLLNLTLTYGDILNDYIWKKHETGKKIQYNFIPIIISPPDSIEPITQSHDKFFPAEIEVIYNTAIEKIGDQNFKVLITVPIQISDFSRGAFVPQKDMQVILSLLATPVAYSETDKKAGFDSIVAFQEMFKIISHEILHANGLVGDHMTLGYGSFLGLSGLTLDNITGKPKIPTETVCDFLGTSPDYYAVELPSVFKITKAEGLLLGLQFEASSSGGCLTGLRNNEILKDFDKDGIYEIMYANQLIGKELQRTLGWTDVDGDGITELIDQTPYGRSEPLVWIPPRDND